MTKALLILSILLLCGGGCFSLDQVLFSKGKRNDIGFFLSGDDNGIKSLDLEAGVCLDFNKMYSVRPDPDSIQEPGRNLIFGLNLDY